MRPGLVLVVCPGGKQSKVVAGASPDLDAVRNALDPRGVAVVGRQTGNQRTVEGRALDGTPSVTLLRASYPMSPRSGPNGLVVVTSEAGELPLLDAVAADSGGVWRFASDLDRVVRATYAGSVKGAGPSNPYGVQPRRRTEHAQIRLSPQLVVPASTATRT